MDDSPDCWISFQARINELNKAAPANTSFKVLFLARHGEGFRAFWDYIPRRVYTSDGHRSTDNVAIEKFGVEVCAISYPFVVLLIYFRA